MKRRAFTVVELLVVISILALLAAMTVSALANAAEQAKAQRTKAIITKLDQLIMEKWDGYRTRAVPYTRGADPRASALARLNAIRELQRLEFPQNAQDVWDDPEFLAGNSVPAVNRGYRSRCLPLASWNSANEESECLYLIVSSMKDGEKNAIDFFSQSEIGDLDEDGQPEILDAWGTPIVFVRWPAGYTRDNATATALTNQSEDGDSSPDPFDPLKVDPLNTDADATNNTFALKPLVYSFGPDKANGIVLTGPNFQYSKTTRIKNDPYNAATPRIGSIGTPSEAADNVTNHAP